MPQDFARICAAKGAARRPAVLAVALALAATCSASSARAGDDDSAWSKFMQTIGLQSKQAEPDTDIHYTERAPLVVPPTRELPPPAASGAPPSPDWPKDPVKRAKRAKPKPEVVPATAVQTPNPTVEKKAWYNPAGWFNKEEYASFNGEPEREKLTDPPAGYRVPSPDQPYGVSPEKKVVPTPVSNGLIPANAGASK